MAHDPPAAIGRSGAPAMHNVLRLAAASLCLVSVAALGGERVAVKPGLWEFSNLTLNSGVPPIPEDMLAKMPPEARARMEAAMQGRGSAGPGAARTYRQCITEQDLEHPFRPEEDKETHCTHKVLSRTATSMAVEMECTSLGKHEGTVHGTFKWRAPTSESMSGTIDMTVTAEGRTMTHQSTITGKWLGTDCGTVKPRKQDSPHAANPRD
jgi:hypothetical protein